MSPSTQARGPNRCHRLADAFAGEATSAFAGDVVKLFLAAAARQILVAKAYARAHAYPTRSLGKSFRLRCV